MPFASIAGVTYQFQNPGITQNKPEYLGRVRRTSRGNARNSTRGGARSWNGTMLPILESDYLTLEANTINRKFITCDGDFLDSIPTICWVEIANAQYFKPSVISPLMRLVTLDIYEVTPATTAFTPSVYRFLLTSVASPDMANGNVSTPDGSYPGDSSSGMSFGAGLVPPTAACPAVPGIVVSATPEWSFLSVPLQDGYAFGTPAVQAEVGTMDNTVWNYGDLMMKLSLKRGGSIVAGPWSSNFVGMGGLSGYLATFLFTASINVTLISGDQFLLDVYARIGLDCGQTDNAQRPFMYTGAVPGPRTSPALILSGDIQSV